MKPVNHATIIGVMDNDPALGYTGEGKAVMNFTVLQENEWNGKVFRTWHKCVVWGGRAEDAAASDLSKGDSVCVIGEIKYRSYEKDGVKKPVVEIHGQVFRGFGEGETVEDKPQTTTKDDIPF